MLVAATLAATGAVVSHRAAAWVHGFAGFDGPCAAEVSTMKDTRVSGLVVHRVASIEPADTMVVRGLRVTRQGRTLLDLADVCDREVVRKAMIEALRLRVLGDRTLERLIAMRGSRGRKGVPLLRELLAEWRADYAGTASELEARFLALLRRAKLPKPPALNVDVHGPDGCRIARPDAHYPRSRVAIFLDGKKWHSDGFAIENDHAQTTRLTLAGWIVLRFTWRQVTGHPDEVVAAVRVRSRARSPSSADPRSTR